MTNERNMYDVFYKGEYQFTMFTTEEDKNDVVYEFDHHDEVEIKPCETYTTSNLK